MKSRLPLAAALAVSLAPLARAQQPSPSPEPSPEAPRYREVVEVQGDLPAVPGPAVGVSKVALDLSEIPVSVSVVSATVIDSQRAIVLTDALRNVSGVNTASGNGVFDFFTVRGFDSLSSGLVLTDGAPEPESTFYPLYNVEPGRGHEGPDRDPLRRQPAGGRRAPGAQAAAAEALRGRLVLVRPLRHVRGHARRERGQRRREGRVPRERPGDRDRLLPRRPRGRRCAPSTRRSPGGPTRARASRSASSTCRATSCPTAASRS